MTGLDVKPTSATAPGQPSLEDVIARAVELIPILRERSARCEELRRIPPETIADLHASGILRCSQPARFGGMGLPANAVAEVAMQIGRGCGSSGWMVGQWSGHNWMLGWFSERAQEEYWADSPDVLSSTASGLVRFQEEPTKGGKRMTGQFKFSSGIDEAHWVILHAPDETCLIPRSDFEILDDWFVAGLRGSGSKSIVFENVFVPEHRMVPNERFVTPPFAGSEHYDDPFYALHNSPGFVLPTMITGQTIGMAQGVVDVFDERVRARREPHTKEPAHERPSNQLDFGESTAEVDGARTLIRKVLEDELAISAAGGVAPIEERARIRRDIAYANKLCVRAVDRLVSSGDSSALYEVNSLHRLSRDTHASALQFAVQWGETATQYSRVLWGLPPQTMLI